MAAGARGAPPRARVSPAGCGTESARGVQSAWLAVTFCRPGRSTARGGPTMPSQAPRIAPSEITPPEVYFSRRTLLAAALAGAASAWAGGAAGVEGAGAPLTYARNARYSVREQPNTFE